MNIKIARIKKGLTQEQLRKSLNISKNKIVQIEKGIYDHVNYPLMIKISKVLGVPVVELFFAE